MLIIAVAVGGAAGAVARYGMSGWVHALTGASFPWGTLIVNVTGSFLIGLVVRYLEAVVVAPEIRALLTIGFLGAFTTFSTYSYETLTLLREGEWSRAALYSGGSVVFGLMAVGLGLATASLILRSKG